MKERPILFSGPMVRAIIERRKTQTRRAINPKVFIEMNEGNEPPIEQHDPGFGAAYLEYVGCPYGQPGDRLWVKEAGWVDRRPLDMTQFGLAADVVRFFRADGTLTFKDGGHSTDARTPFGRMNEGERTEWLNLSHSHKRVPPIYMPRWASRLTLEVTEVRAQRLQDITEEDAQAEGAGLAMFEVNVPGRAGPLRTVENHRAGFACLWDSINAKRGLGWGSNPWVRAITFEVVQ